MCVNTRSGNCYAEGTVETGDNVRKCQSVSQSECPELSGLTQTPVTPSHRHTVSVLTPDHTSHDSLGLPGQDDVESEKQLCSNCSSKTAV